MEAGYIFNFLQDNISERGIYGAWLAVNELDMAQKGPVRKAGVCEHIKAFAAIIMPGGAAPVGMLYRQIIRGPFFHLFSFLFAFFHLSFFY